MSRNKFFFFGCWNYDNCKEGGLDYRKGVIDMIANEIDRYSFGIIAGDNAYARDDDVYYKRTIEYGFELLRGLSRPLYDAIGNHEVVDDVVLQHEQAQKLLAVSEDMHVADKDGFRIVTINTNLFSHKIKNKDKPSGDALLDQFRRLLLCPYQGWTIVVGHEPLISQKRKGSHFKTSSLIIFDKLIAIMAQCKRVVYMCADVHEFQAWNIYYGNSIIPMIVVGTGGAIPDTPLGVQDYSINNINNTGIQALLVATQPAYGYCEVALEKDYLAVNYVPLLGCGDKPEQVHLLINKNKETSLLTETKSRKSKSLECQAPVIDEDVCADKRVLYKKPPKLKPSSSALPLSVAEKEHLPLPR